MFDSGLTHFVNGDIASSLTMPPTLTTMATAGSHVSGSPYTITASGAVGADRLGKRLAPDGRTGRH